MTYTDYVQCNKFQSVNPDCENKIRIEPLETTQYREIHCDRCNTDFSILNSEIEHTRV